MQFFCPQYLRLAPPILLLLLAGASMAVAAASNCKLVRIEEWPVRLEHDHLIVDGSINGQRIGIILDTGAADSLILRSAAVRLGLERRWLRGYVIFGVGGETDAETAYVEEFKIGQAARKGWRVMVAGERDFGGDAAFLLGEDFFRQTDVEFDLAHNVVRLFQAKDCGGVALAYWATDVVGEVEIDRIRGRNPWIVLTVRINGQPVKAVVDSGASTSLLDRRVAARLGVTTETPGVVAGGRAVGMGKKSVDLWLGPFQSFAIGNESIKDTIIPFADFLAEVPGDVPPEARMPPMVLGIDFLRAHRVLVAHSQRKIYFTHVGGPVFVANPQYAHAYSNRGIAWAKKGEHDRAIADYNEAIRINPRDALPYNNRGNAWVNKDEYDKAIADYNEAIRINPEHANAYPNRGNAWRIKGEYDKAVADFNEAIRINPRHAQAYRTRALVRFAQGQFASAQTDFAEAQRLNPSDAYAAIWRHLAQARAGHADAASKELSSGTAAVDKAKWPAPVIELFAGSATAAAVMNAADNGDSQERRDQVCEAAFYVGEWHLLQGHHDEARAFLGRAERECKRSFYEYSGAAAELARLGR